MSARKRAYREGAHPSLLLGSSGPGVASDDRLGQRDIGRYYRSSSECNNVSQALGYGLAKPLLFNLKTMYQILKPEKINSKSISSLDNLCEALNISVDELNEALNLPESEKYTEKTVPKSNGAIRHVFKPHHLLRKIQRRINKRIFTKLVKWPSYLYGTLPNDLDGNGDIILNRDYINCARQHCQSKSLLKVDIKDFFDNIHEDYVFEIFHDFLKYPDDVSKALTKICCHNKNVVQGALTSSYISCLSLWNMEHKIVKRLQRKNLIYTRLVDDITVSSKVSNYNFEAALSHIKNMLYERDLPLNIEKTRPYYISMEPLTVHGLRVNFDTPRLPSDEVRKIRAAVHNISKLSSEPGYRTTFAYRKDYNRCIGRVNKLKRIGHEKHEALLKKLIEIPPLPSRKDIERTRASIERLERDFQSKGSSYWYYKRFYRAHGRLNVQGESFRCTNVHK